MKQNNHFKIVCSGFYSEICPENLIHFPSHKTHAKLHFQVIVCVCVCVYVCVSVCVCVCVCVYTEY